MVFGRHRDREEQSGMESLSLRWAQGRCAAISIWSRGGLRHKYQDLVFD
jgi:hypothetical protein